MSVLQVFPNCTPVLHPNVFVSLFVLISFSTPHSLSFLPSCSLLLFLILSSMFLQSQQLFLSNYMWNCLPIHTPPLLFLQKAWCDFQLHKGWCQIDWHALTCCQICHSPLQPLSSSSSSLCVFTVTAVAVVTIIIVVIIAFPIFLLSVAFLSNATPTIWRVEMRGW